MGRWTPLVLMAGGLAILMGTLLGINFPMREPQTVSNNAPGDKASKVLPANINVNSSAPSRNRGNATTPENRSNVAQQEDFNAGDNSSDNTSDSSSEERGNVSQEDRRSTSRTNVAQSNANESPSSSDNNDTSNNNSSENTTDNSSDTTTEVQSTTTSSPSNQDREPIRALW
ncbi:hypothetical protein ACQFX9_01125 [Aliinostoc sp. HNIBRCY26]|uniref:hypothetical protein n=1 Tax=Aliinostoc sp. HNIBRCY26 TaxID=3418997 RepID=UPI003CFF3BBA